MPFSAIILAHKGPRQVQRLVERLAPNPVLLHVDAAAPAATWAQLAAVAGSAPNVTLLPRRRTAWGSWALVEAAFDGLALALEQPAWTHAVLLSGQDYPLRRTQAIEALLEDHAHTSFAPHWALPSPLWGRRGGLDRVHNINLRVGDRRLQIPWRRRPPAGLRLTGGSMYWALTAEAAARVLATRRARPDWIRFLRGSWIPDELAVPSLLMSAQPPVKVLNENLTFIRWSDPGAAHPDTLTADDAEELARAASGPSSIGGAARAKLFGRKFDVAVDGRILDWIDAELLDA